MVLLGWLILVIVIVVVLYLASLYNRLMTFRNRVDNAWAQVDVQLRRRYDVIPNLVETAKGYVSHEREVFENVARARQVAISAQGPQEKGGRRKPADSGTAATFCRSRGLSSSAGQ